jgi:uncharacterized damage-inducible protein DinB
MLYIMRNDPWIAFVVEQFATQKKSIEKAAGQLSDAEFTRRPAPGFNSVATIVRHLAGNLASRFADFLTTDGEKPTRDRESEFADWPGTRAELMMRWDASWATLFATLDSLTDADLDRVVTIRSKPVPVRAALVRALDHVAGHVGQVAYVGRLVHEGAWQWLSIPPGESRAFNERMGHR